MKESGRTILYSQREGSGSVAQRYHLAPPLNFLASHKNFSESPVTLKGHYIFFGAPLQPFGAPGAFCTPNIVFAYPNALIN